MKEYYVLLTGSKNNAGDFLIKYRAKELLKKFRTDREIIDFDRWKPITNEQLDSINKSKALILTGGPALQKNFYPGIYPLLPNLNDIRVPIIMMGIGYKEQMGLWEGTAEFVLSDSSIQLLKKIDSSGYLSSVRDFHTMNVLKNKSINNVVMTGCPALYDLKTLESSDSTKNFSKATIKQIAFSLGVSYLESKSMQKQMKDCIIMLKENFYPAEVTVVFHHSINTLIKEQKQMIDWLQLKAIRFLDISGSAENLINVYSRCDLHVGYRVHAHIFCSSIMKPSVLLSEDSRGRALKKVLHGEILDACFPQKQTLFLKIKNRIGFYSDKFEPKKQIIFTLKNILKEQVAKGFDSTNQSIKNILGHFQAMKTFIEQLP